MINILRIGKVNFTEDLIIFEVDNLEEKYDEKVVNKEKFCNFIKAEFPEEWDNYSLPLWIIGKYGRGINEARFDVEDFINDKRLNENSILTDILNKFLTDKKYN